MPMDRLPPNRWPKETGSTETVQVPAPEPVAAPVVEPPAAPVNEDPFRGHGGDYEINEKGHRVPVKK